MFGIAENTSFRSIFSILACLIFCTFNVCHAEIEFAGFSDNEPVQPDSLDKIAVQEWLVIKSTDQAEEAETITVLDRKITLCPQTVAIAGTTSELMFIVVLQGKVVSEDKHKAKAGQLLAWTFFGKSEAATFTYDASKFESNFEFSSWDNGKDLLKAVIRKQKKKSFWGLLRPTSVNLGKPYNSEYEAGRQRFLLIPELVRVKIASTDSREYQLRTGHAFLNALAQGDVDTVAALLNPLMFTKDKRTPLSYDEWMVDRRRFAQKLVKMDWKFEEIPELTAIDDSNALEFIHQGESFKLTFTVYHDTLFVTSIDSKETTP